MLRKNRKELPTEKQSSVSLELLLYPLSPSLAGSSLAHLPPVQAPNPSLHPQTAKEERKYSVTLSQRLAAVHTAPFPGPSGPLLPICCTGIPHRRTASPGMNCSAPRTLGAATAIPIVKEQFSLPCYTGNFLSCLQASL